MYILIHEDCSIETTDVLTKDLMDAVDAGVLDILNVSSVDTPNIYQYVKGNWEVLRKV